MDQLLMAITNYISTLIFDITEYLGIPLWYFALFFYLIFFCFFLFWLHLFLKHEDIDYFFDILEELERELILYKSSEAKDCKMEELIKKQEEEKYDLLLKFKSDTDITMEHTSLLRQLHSENQDVINEMFKLKVSLENIIMEISNIKELLKYEIMTTHFDMSRLIILKNQKNLILFRFYEQHLRKKCAAIYGFESIFYVKKVIKNIEKIIKKNKKI